MIDVKNCKRRDGGEFVIYTTEGKSPEYPIVGEIKNSNGDWSLRKWTKDGEAYGFVEHYNLIESHPLDGVELGTPILVWDCNGTTTGWAECLPRLFAGVSEKGKVLARLSPSGQAIEWDHGLTIDQYAEKYLK